MRVLEFLAMTQNTDQPLCCFASKNESIEFYKQLSFVLFKVQIPQLIRIDLDM